MKKCWLVYHLNVLYYGEPAITRGGGVGKVAYYLPQALKKKVTLTYLGGIRSDSKFPTSYLKIFSHFVRQEFDIFHFNANPAWINGSSILFRLAKLRQTHTILNIHGIPQLERRAEQWDESVPFSAWMSTLTYSNLADRIVVNSEFMRRNVVDWFKVNRDKVIVIPNGVDMNVFTKSNNGVLLDGDPCVLFVGHLAILKGVDVLIRATAKLKIKLPNIKLHLVGGGNIHAFSLLARQYGVEKNVVFHGWVEQSKLSRYYKSANFCIFPSRHEGFGLVILEAMALGIPVIASDIPTFKEIIADGNDGVMFKSEDADALSDKVLTLYYDPKLRNELGSNAFEKAKKYSWENIADQYIALYKVLRQN
jgi:glycosyltransferase involved in cell wall biosynthesis